MNSLFIIKKFSEKEFAISIFFIIALVNQISYWYSLISNYEFNEYIPVLLRATDPVYYYFFGNDKLINNWGETYTIDGFGGGAQVVNIIHLLPEIVLYKLTGNPYIFLFFDIIYLFLGLFLINLLFEKLVSDKFSCLFLTLLLHTVGSKINWLIPYFGNYFQDRFPRPNITNIVYLLCLIMLLNLFNEKRLRAHVFFYLGCLIGLMLYVNFYEVQIILITTSIVFLCKMNHSSVKRSVVSTFLGFTIVSSYWMYNQFRVNPEQVERAGLFSVENTSYAIRYFFKIIISSYLYVIIVFVFALLISLVIKRKNYFKDRNGEVIFRMKIKKWHPLYFTFIVLLSAVLSMPLTIILLNKTIQPMHYIYEISIALSIMICCLASIIMKPMFKRINIRYFILIIFLATILSSKDISYAINRSETGNLSGLHDLNQVIQYLNKEPKETFVIATNSYTIAAWWAGLKDKFVLLPHPLVSTLKEEDLFKRFSYFSRELGLDNESFIEMLKDPNVVDAFLGHFKFTPSQFRETEDQYSSNPDSIFSKAFELPKNKISELITIYEECCIYDYKVDIFVIKKEDYLTKIQRNNFNILLENNNYLIIKKM